MNPVKANVVKNPLKYKFSSLKEYETEKNQIIHLRAIEVYKTEFMDFQDYLEFHNKGVQYVFIDTPDEVLFQQQERAVAIINQEAHLMGLETAKEIIEDQTRSLDRWIEYFLYDEERRKWHLSPAYDLTVSHTSFGEHSTTVMKKGKDIKDDDLRMLADEFAIKERKRDEIIRDTKNAVKK